MKKILLQQIIAFFQVTYSHQLANGDVSSLANILFSRGVTPELVSFAVMAGGAPHSNPDSNFIPEKVFQLWNILRPIMVSFKKNNLLQIFCEAILYPHLIKINESNTRVLSVVFQNKSKANLGYTRYLCSSFLGKSEFNTARRFNETDPLLANCYYLSCIEHLMMARKLSLREDRFNCGMVGVSHYYIAHFISGEEKKRHLSLSIKNLEMSENLGDKTTDHFKFLGEAFLEIASETDDLDMYMNARDKLMQACKQDPLFTSAIDSLSECEFKIGVNEYICGQYTAPDHLNESIRLCDLFEKLEKQKECSKAVIQGRRGKASLYLWYHNKKDTKLLDKTIEELQEANKGDPLNWSYSLANALFERYRLYMDSDETTDLQKAKNLNDHVHNEDIQEDNHFKLRGRIYLEWGKNFADKEAYKIALKSFKRCTSDDPLIKSYIGYTLANRGIHFGNKDDLREAIKQLEEKPKLSDQEESKVGLLPKIYRELAMMIFQEQLKESLSLLDKAIAILDEKYIGCKPSTSQELSEYHSIIGSTYHDRYKLSSLPEDIHNAVKHFQQAYDLGMTDTVLSGRFGRACLQIGKLSNEPEGQSGFFEDAIEYMELSRKAGNEEASNYSELGEAYLRLYRIRKDTGILKKALDMFLESFHRGNDSPQNLGMIGDCYYHLSYYKNSVANLFKALEFKAKAREVGHESKEHFSVVGRIHLLLYKKLGTQDYFIDGIRFICKARDSDKTWPWPVCQLAEVTERFSDKLYQLKSESQKEESFFCHDKKIWRLFLEKNSEGLWLEGAKLAANYPEAMKKILGGKSRVYIAGDQHGLISSTYVFKPGDPEGRLPNGGLQRLHDEQERTEKMNQYLKQINAEKFLVPTSVGILSLGKTKLYTMRRATGQNLSDLILYGPSQYCMEAIRDTIKFLALYHSWHIFPQENKEQVVEESRKSVLKRIRHVITHIGLSTSLAYSIIALIEPLFEIMRQLPLVEKRDAHPDNWIVTNEGKIVIIDLEQPKPPSQFILSELVQLIEDLPYLPWDQKGWQSRKALIKNYLKYYNNFRELKSVPRVSISPELEIAGYLSFTIWRALWGIGFAFGKEQRKWISSGSKLRWENRVEHYLNLINVVPPIWTEENIHFAAPDWKLLLNLIEKVSKELYNLRQKEG